MRTIWALSKLVIKEIFRKKDFYVVLILTLVILLYAGQLQFYHVENIIRYLKEIGLALIFLSSVILTVSLAARQYPLEIHNRTFNVLMAKPVARYQFILGKFCGVSLAGITCLLIFLALFTLLTLTKSDSFSPILSIQMAYLFCLSLMVLSAMTIAFSFYLTYSANVALSLILYLLMSTYGATLKQSSTHLSWTFNYLGSACYYLLPHFEFFDLRQRFIHEWAPISLGLMGVVTVYAFVYTTFFILTGWTLFKKRFL